MIYLYKNNFNEIVTDNVINFIPSTLEIYLNDTKLGEYLNYSTSLLYLYFESTKVLSISNIPIISFVFTTMFSSTLRYINFPPLRQSRFLF